VGRGFYLKIARAKGHAYAQLARSIREGDSVRTEVIQSFGRVTPEQIDGSEEREIVLQMRGEEMRFTGQRYLIGFVIPNVTFHCTTAYNILRHNGVDLGKRDFLGAF